MITRRG